jgi:hypothetical protein
VRTVSGGRRRYGRAAPLPALVALALVVVLLVVLDRRAGSADAASDAGVPGTAAPVPAGGAGGLAFGRGAQQRHTVHEDAPAGSCRHRSAQGRPLPDPACTPGAVDPAVTPATLARTICVSGYTGRIRPPVSVTGQEKRLSARAYGYRESLATAEYDHLVPLGLGGDPNDARNLWLEPNDDASATTNTNGKDAVEETLHAAVCAGRVGLAPAQRAIAANWVTALQVLGVS